MTPATLALTIYRGAHWQGMVVQCLDEEDVAVDLTGWTAHAVVRQTMSGPVLLDLAPVISTPLTGIVTIPEITDELTAALPLGAHYWDLILEDPDGKRLGPYASGKCTVCSLVTHA